MCCLQVQEVMSTGLESITVRIHAGGVGEQSAMRKFSCEKYMFFLQLHDSRGRLMQQVTTGSRVIKEKA